MRLLRPRQIKPADTDGKVLTTVAGKTTWGPGGGLPVGGTTGQALKKASNADGDVTWGDDLQGAGGGSGGVGRDRRWNKSAAATTVDEYNDDVLDPAWVRVDGTGAPAANVAWAEGADVLSMVQSAGDTSGAAGHALLRPCSSVAVGDAFTAGIQLLVPSTANYPTFGIMLADGTTFGSGAQVLAVLANSAGATDMFPGTWSYTGFNTRAALTASGAFLFTRGIYVHLRLVRTSTGWRTDISADGVGWVIGAVLAATVTPTYVGLFASTFGQAGTKFAASVDYLRRFSGVS